MATEPTCMWAVRSSKWRKLASSPPIVSCHVVVMSSAAFLYAVVDGIALQVGLKRLFAALLCGRQYDFHAAFGAAFEDPDRVRQRFRRRRRRCWRWRRDR